jgi:hypothetical protein
MSYNINLTNGTTLIPGGLSDGSIDVSHSSLTLIGRNYAGYGQFLNENFISLLENFANGTGPSNPLKGQLWWDTANNILRVWSGVSWKISTGATSREHNSPPGDLSSLGGDLWFDNTNGQLNVYSGTGWITVGPTQTPATGNTGTLPALITDTSGSTHVVIQFTISGTIYAILSKDTFSSALAGFTTVKAGLNFTTLGTALVINTQDINATASTIVQRDGAGSTSVNGLTAATVNATGSVTAPTIIGRLTGNVVGNVSATTISASTISTQGINASSGYTGTILTGSQPNITSLTGLTSVTITGSATLNGSAIIAQNGPATLTTITATTAILPSANLTVNIGSSSSWFNNIYGTAVHAQYADLAERFHSDAEYAPGTVVEMGGPNEITQVVAELSESVFGVISTNAAYLMNSGAGTNDTHPPIAMSGRVPVRVVGLITKGDRLVSAGNGLARSGKQSELTPWNVIGRALVDKTEASEGVIEAIVKINS